jgi:predicted naringenin-chalcone synthase
MDQPITIAATSTALPPHEITRDDVKRYFGSTFAIDERRLNAMMAIVDNSQVRRRFFIHPVDYIIEPRPLATVTASSGALDHPRTAGGQCVCRSGSRAFRNRSAHHDVVHRIHDPSLDAHLIAAWGFGPRRDGCRR